MLGARLLLCSDGVSEVGGEGFSSAFEFFEDAFDGIPIPVGDILESE
jgi:hypothetical protein